MTKLTPEYLLTALCLVGGGSILGFNCIGLVVDIFSPHFPTLTSGQLRDASAIVTLKASFGAFLFMSFIFAIKYWASVSAQSKANQIFHSRSIALGLATLGIDYIRELILRVRRLLSKQGSAVWNTTATLHQGQNGRNWALIVPGAWSGPWSASDWKPLAEAIDAAHESGATVYFWIWNSSNSWQGRQESVSYLVEKLIELHRIHASPGLLVGHSHGGTVATLAAAKLTEMEVGRIVTIGTPFFTISKSDVASSSLNLHLSAVNLAVAAPVVIFAYAMFYQRAFVNLMQDTLHFVGDPGSERMLSSAVIDLAILLCLTTATALLTRLYWPLDPPKSIFTASLPNLKSA